MGVKVSSLAAAAAMRKMRMTLKEAQSKKLAPNRCNFQLYLLQEKLEDLPRARRSLAW